jgi:hypothetical protein
MNEEVKRKLFDLEIDPPGKMWDKIAAALDDEVAAEFPAHLHDLEIKPPSKVWSGVAAALDSGVALNFPNKLYNLELQPPIDSWQKISIALDKERMVPGISPVRRIPVYKYVVAASLLALIGFGVKWLTTERIGAEVAIQNTSTQKIEAQPKNEDNLPNTQTTISTEDQKSASQKPAVTNNLPKEGPRQAVAFASNTKSNTRRSGNYMTAAYKIPKPAFASSDGFCMTNLKTNVPGNKPNFSDAAYRYLVFENDNCELIRMSKKLAEKLGCNAPDQNTPEYQNCIQQLKKWSEKIAQMNITPSPDNFMNIFELLKSTEEKQF